MSEINIKTPPSYSIDSQNSADRIMSNKKDDFIYYFEDSGKEFIYQFLLMKLFDSEIPKTHIRCVGGVGALIKKYNDDSLKGDKKSIYIADGDFSWILDNQIKSNCFIYLNKYCIESYLINESLITNILMIKMQLPREDVRNKLNFHEWEKEIMINYLELFKHFILVQKKNVIGKKNVKEAHKFVNDKGYINQEKFSQYKDSVKNTISDYEGEIASVSKKIMELNNPIDIICGKTLIKGLFHYLNTSGIRCFGGKKNLKEELLLSFNIKELFFLKDKIINYISSAN